MSFTKKQSRLQKFTMDELVEMMDKIATNPKNKSHDKNSVYIHTPQARKRMDDIGWAIQGKLREARERSKNE